MITKEHLDACFADPAFVGVVYQQFYRIGGGMWPAGNEQLMSKSAGREVVDQIVALESEVFVVTPVFTRTARAATAAMPLDSERELVLLAAADGHYKMYTETFDELMTIVKKLGLHETCESLIEVARNSGRQFVLYNNVYFII